MIHLYISQYGRIRVRQHIIFVCALLLFFTASPAHAFKPTAEYGHVGIVRDAVMPITRNTTTGSPLKFSERAILEMRDATAGVDEIFSSRGELSVPLAHCDDELLPACSGRMRTIRNNVITILIGFNDGTRARAEVGRAFHTLQDFYSHSNWVNIPGNPLFNPLLGRGIESSLPLASQTCIDDFLDNTLAAAGLVSLTSGYFGDAEPPANKCAHGILPFAGIHKDKPGRPSHVPARAAAVAGTRDFVNQILDAIAGNDKALRAFMDVRPPIGFVIDDTGSMGPTILGVRSAIAAMVTSLIASETEPDQYVLVRFGDPNVGSAFVTSDGNQLVSRVNTISPFGGDDCPELGMTGLLRAINAIGTDGTLFLFTDASAKDGSLAGNVVAAANTKNVSIWVQQSGSCALARAENYDQNGGGVGAQHTLAEAVVSGEYRKLTRERKGATNVVPPADPYSFVTQGTGGQHLLSANTEQAVEGFFNVIGPAAGGELETVLLADGLLPAGIKSYSFPVDSSIATLLASVNFTVPGSVILLRPDNSPVLSGDPGVTITSLTSGQIISIEGPDIGAWELQITGTEGVEYAVNISGVTKLALTRFDFVEERGREEHTGLFPISGSPVLGQPQTVLASMAGPFDTAAFKTVSLAGEFVSDVLLVQGGAEVADDDFSGTYTIGSVPVRLVVEGLNDSAEAYRRTLQKPLVGAAVEVEVLQELVALEILSFEQFDAHFRVTNHGADAMFEFTGSSSIDAQLTANFASALIPSGAFVDVVLTLDVGPVFEESGSITLLASNPDTSNSAILLRTALPLRISEIPADVRIPEFPADGAFPASLTVTNGAIAGWSVDPTDSFEGPDSIRSDIIGHDQFASVEATVDFKGGPFIFARKVSSEFGYDFLSFYVNDVLVESWSGDLSWGLVGYNIPEGQYKFRWSYEKDFSVSSPIDAAWIDALQIDLGEIVFSSGFEDGEVAAPRRE